LIPFLVLYNKGEVFDFITKKPPTITSAVNITVLHGSRKVLNFGEVDVLSFYAYW
jgi:hypothetical protein